MASTVVAMYDNFQSANNAVQELVDNGFSRDAISFLTRDPKGESTEITGDVERIEPSSASEGAGVGAGIGAVLGGLGGLLVGLGALAIPGIGPVIAAGPLAAALTTLAGAGAGAVAGGVTGGLIGALVDMGVPEETAQYYAEGLRRGSHLVTLNVEDYLVDQAVDILNRHHPVDMNERVNDWRQTGWSGFEQREESGWTGSGMEGAGTLDTDTGTSRRDWPASSGQPLDARQGYQAGLEDVNRLETGESAGLYGAGRQESGFETEDISSDYDDFRLYDNRFRQHFESHVFAGDADYHTYEPAYRYGYNLARDERFRGSNWEDLEMEAHRSWDERNPGTWERFKDTIRHAWEEVKDSV